MFSDVETFSEAPLGKKTNKPLMEKKRRARINRCLAELKDILIKDNHVSASHAKWEKADILEMTVDYVKKLRSTKDSHELKRAAPSEEPEEVSKSPVSICSPPSTSSTEFCDAAPEAKRQRRCDKEPGQPRVPIPTYPFHPNFLAQQLYQSYLTQLQNHQGLKMAAIAPSLPMTSAYTAATLGSAVPLSSWR